MHNGSTDNHDTEAVSQLSLFEEIVNLQVGEAILFSPVWLLKQAPATATESCETASVSWLSVFDPPKGLSNAPARCLCRIRSHSGEVNRCTMVVESGGPNDHFYPGTHGLHNPFESLFNYHCASVYFPGMAAYSAQTSGRSVGSWVEMIIRTPRCRCSRTADRSVSVKPRASRELFMYC
jgi:hypothetical protein